MSLDTQEIEPPYTEPYVRWCERSTNQVMVSHLLDFYLKWEVIWMNINWIKVFVAAFLEVFWVIGLTHSHDLWTWTGTVILIIVSNYLMISAAQVLPAGTVYAIFVGIGTGGTVVAEILFFGEPFRWGKIFLIAVLLSGVIGL